MGQPDSPLHMKTRLCDRHTAPDHPAGAAKPQLEASCHYARPRDQQFLCSSRRLAKAQQARLLEPLIIRLGVGLEALVDFRHKPYLFPPHIFATTERPDILIYSLRVVIFGELTCPAEEGIAEASLYKQSRYADTVDAYEG